MDGGKHRIFPIHYDKGKKLFHVVVKLSDAPGSYSSVLDLLRTKVNLIGTSTYTLSDGTAMFSGFAEALSPKETRESLRELILRSKVAIDTEIKEGREGLLIDTFHTGFAVGEEEYVLLRKGGLVHMFDHIGKILGSGGEALLYEEGLTMSIWDIENMGKEFGEARVRSQASSLTHFMAAQGWGEVETKDGPGKGEFTVAVRDCFECSGRGLRRKSCSFLRGYFTGAANALYGKEYSSEETKCIRSGAKACEFQIVPKT